MVCVASFIILCLLSVFVGILSIFRRDIGKRYWKTFKKAWGCVGKKITFQKCDTSFKDDIKNSILRKFVIKKPKLVKPIGITIEVTAVLIVAITVWSLATAVKSGLSLWVFGTCNVSQPSACLLGSEVCSIDQVTPEGVVEKTKLWFTEWGEIFSAIPDRLRTWEPREYLSETYSVYGDASTDDKPIAIDIFDPGCIVCLQSFKNQLASGFMDEHAVVLLPYPIVNPDGGYRFKNSHVITRFLLANEDYAKALPDDSFKLNSWSIVEKIFTESDSEGLTYQEVFNNRLSNNDAKKMLQDWLLEFGYSEADATKIAELADSETITNRVQEIKRVVDEDISAKGIPTMIYGGKKHIGLFKAK